MPGLFSRIKTWVSLEDVSYSTLNAEFDNIITNFVPLMMDDYSTNATQMQVQTDPGESGTESLATTLAGELARIRFVLNEMKGTTYWYTSSTTSLSELANVVGGGIRPNRISAGKTASTSDQPAFLVPNGAARTITLDVTPTSFVYYIAGVQYTISTSDVSITSLTAGPSSNNTCLVNVAGLAAQDYSKYLGEYDSTIPIDNVGSEISALNGKIAALKIVNGSAATEYILAYVDTTNGVLKNCVRGAFIDSTSAAVPRVVFSDNNTITLLKLSWIYAKTDGTLAVSYTNPRVAYTEPSSPAVGDYWYDLSTSLWKVYSGVSFGAASATLIGICAQDATNCIAARSFDIFKQYEDKNTITLLKNSVTEIRSARQSAEVSSYGTVYKYEKDYIRWNTATDFESGVSEAASTLYYLYVTEDGAPKISNKHPLDRRSDLYGLYHPNESWRCVGQVFNNVGSDFVDPLDYVTKYDNPLQITSGVGSNALTLTLNAPLTHKITIPSISTDTINQRTLLGPQALTISSGSTLGHTSAMNNFIHPYLLDVNAGILDLAASSSLIDDGSLQSTTAEGGAGAADSASVIYSTIARTNVPLKILGRLRSNQTTAGTWATALNEVNLKASESRIIQTVNYATGAVDSTTTQTPVDDTIPTSSEGKELMSLAITPTSADNKLLIQIVANVAQSGAGGSYIVGALFQDSGAAAINAGMVYIAGAAQNHPLVITHYMDAGTTSATTFKFRAGPGAAVTLTFNGQAAARLFGGVYISSITITEIAV